MTFFPRILRLQIPDIIRKHDAWQGILSAKQDIGKLISQAQEIA